MRDVNEDVEYRALKERVKAREVDMAVWSGVGLLALGAAVLTFMFAPAGIAVVAGLASSAMVGAVAGYKAFRAEQDVRFDTNEMDARRDAMNLRVALGKTQVPEEAATAYAMGKRRENELKKRLAQEKAKGKGDDGWIDYLGNVASNTSAVER